MKALKALKTAWLMLLCASLSLHVPVFAIQTPAEALTHARFESPPTDRLVSELGDVFSDRPQLMTAFVDALLDGGNHDKIQALGAQIENSEETFMRLFQIVIEKHSNDPHILEAISEGSKIFEERLKTQPQVKPSWFTRMFEFALFSITYVGLIYSLHSLDPTVADMSFRSAFKDNLGIYTVGLVILMKQGMGLRTATSQYFSSLRNRMKSKDFIQNFRRWLTKVPKNEDLRVISLTSQIHQYSISSPEQRGLSAKIMKGYLDELKKLKRHGLLKGFIDHFKTRKLQRQIHKLTEYLSPEELRKLAEERPDGVQLKKLKPRFKSVFIYNKVRSEIVNWLSAQNVDHLANVRTEIQERIGVYRDRVILRSRVSPLEMFNIQLLTIGTMVIGLGFAMGSNPSTPFDEFFPQQLLNFFRSDHGKYQLSIATLILPAFSLALHELTWIASLRSIGRKWDDSSREIRKKIQSLQRVLDILDVVERDPQIVNGRQQSAQKELSALSAHQLIQELLFEVNDSRPVDLCEQLLTQE